MALKANFETWDLRPHRTELIGSSPTLADAIKAGRNDSGRTITVYDSMGRIAARMRDGKVLDADTVTGSALAAVA